MASPTPPATSPLSFSHRLGRAVLLVLGVSSLVTGIWGGLLRVPLALPLPVHHGNWIVFHGPLMVCGFVGTLIGLERAVGLRSAWTYLVPLLTGVGAASIALGVPGSWPRWALSAGSILFVLVSLRILRLQPELSNGVMGLGALAWAVGNLFWTCGFPVPHVVLWWLTFLLLVVAGERIQLTRYQKPSRWARPWLLGALALLAGGLVTGWMAPRVSGILAGVALFALAAWLARFDLARRNLRQGGLPRFMAVCLLSGYGWLLATALLVAAKWPQMAGFVYDATLHAFFVGFVFSMIFGHAPLIFPSVLGLPIHFRWTSYMPLAVLHGSLLLRVTGDLAVWPAGRAWGSSGNAIAVGLFLLNVVAGFALPAKGSAR